PQFNVLPQKASVTVNFRTMPGVTIKDVEKHIRDSVKNKDIDVEFLVGKESSQVSPTDSKAFQTIKELAEAQNSKNLVTPFLVMGGTDAYNYEPVCENIYRFAPFVADTKLLLCTHGTNERIPIACCEDAIAFFKRYTRRMTQD
ncbi:MAG: M20/M25/M40 family metallo-hydrolase, partial [Clostridia bacterium]|nr:M20/M25/M40 family metallo-hydrolase [Clostridia bacterium]